MGKKQIRNQTDYVVDNYLQNKTFRLNGQMDIFHSYANDTLKDGNPNGTDISVITDEQITTAAKPAILPMRISTAGKTGRISFTLLINPDSLTHSKTFLTHNTYTRKGWIPQLWGPNQDTLSGTGYTAAFMNASVGLDNYITKTSLANLNFLALLTTFKNNGYIFADFTNMNAVTRVISKVSGVEIMYDNDIYMGHFNTFTIDESADNPYLLHYNFEFVISTLNNNGYQVRGHFQKLKLAENGKDGLTKGTDTRTAEDPESSTLTADAYNRPTSNKLTRPRVIDDNTTLKIWNMKTNTGGFLSQGLPWSEAFRLGLTDGSVQGNLELRKNLLNQNFSSDVDNELITKTGLNLEQAKKLGLSDGSLVDTLILKKLLSDPKLVDKIINLWVSVTELPWGDAISLKLTDGSLARNIALYKRLTTKTWNKEKKVFE